MAPGGGYPQPVASEKEFLQEARRSRDRVPHLVPKYTTEDNSPTQSGFKLVDMPTSTTGMSRRRFSEDAEAVRKRLPHLVPSWTFGDDEEVIGEFQLVSTPTRQLSEQSSNQEFTEMAKESRDRTPHLVSPYGCHGNGVIACHDVDASELKNKVMPLDLGLSPKNVTEPAPELSPDHKPLGNLRQVSPLGA